MTRGAKIVVFSVVGLFVLAGIYYGFMAPTTPTESISDSSPQVSESPTLTMTPAIDGQPLNGMGNTLPEIGAATTGTTTGTMTANPNGLPTLSGPAFAPSTGNPIGTPIAIQNPTVVVGGTAFPSDLPPTNFTPIVTNSPAPLTPEKKVVATKAKSPSFTVYTVEAGDTLTAISGVWFKDTNRWKEIVAVNPGLSASNLKIGQKINLPAKAGGASAKVASTTQSSGSAVSAGSQHVVVSGETLASISDKAYGNRSNWKKIYEANKSVIGANPSTLKVGMKLTIPGNG